MSIDMHATDVLATIEKLGKPERAAIHQRHGSGSNVCGVLTSDLAKIQKKIKVDHALAMELWKTGNAEARMLALQIADPAKLTCTDADRFIKDGPVHFVSCYLSALVAAQSHRRRDHAPLDEVPRRAHARTGLRNPRRPPERRPRLKAAAAYREALALATNPAERRYLERWLGAVVCF